MMQFRRFSRPAVLAVAFLTTGCADSVGPPMRPPAGLNIIPLPAGHANLYNPRVSFDAVKGQDVEANIYFDDGLGGQGDEYLRFRVRPRSLLRRPDGTLIQNGESVRITITVVNPDSILFNFQPAGLQFDPNDPADLKIDYGETGDDLDDDGDVDPQDAQIEGEISIWRQPTPGAQYIRLQPRSHDQSLDEIEADVLGFSRFALAYLEENEVTRGRTGRFP